jgi:HK97 family phage prohead protease
MNQNADFQWDVLLDGSKAVVTEDESGDLYIEGYASDYETDRDAEAFEPGALQEGMKAFLETNPILVYHHQKGFALGQVVGARFDEKGMFIRSRVDKPEPYTKAADIFRKIKKGTIRAFSVAGQFYRRKTDNGPRIYKADIHEISVTPLPVNPRTLFTVAQKAFKDSETEDPLSSESQKSLEDTVKTLETVFTKICHKRQ